MKRPKKVEVIINSPIEKVWELFTEPEHITKWYYASNNWHTPFAENDLRAGGKFKIRVESKDGTMGFDFEGVYNDVEKYKSINYTIADGRDVEIIFNAQNDFTTVTEIFETENIHPIELQREGWQAILNNFKMYVEKS